jgi:hypothetical protein
VLSWCRDTAALLNHSRSPNLAPGVPSVAPYLPPDTVRPRSRWRGGIGEAGLSVWRATRDIDAGEELVLDYDVFSLFTEGGAGEGGWFAALFPALLDGGVYPDHRQWGTSTGAGSPGELDNQPIALTEPEPPPELSTAAVDAANRRQVSSPRDVNVILAPPCVFHS